MRLGTFLRSFFTDVSPAQYLGSLAFLFFASAATLAPAQEITGTSKIGPRSSHIFTLRIPPDLSVPSDLGDTLPPGNDIFFQFGIFDTGSRTVAINNVPLTATDGTVFQSTANFLDLCGPGDADCGTPTATQNFVPGLVVLDVRVWGLAVVTPSGAPLSTPEAEVAGVLVEPAPITANLIGAPVANNVLAYIDYTNEINNSSILVPGADMTFYEPGAAGAPVPLYELQLQRFGSTTPSTIGGFTRGELYSLVDFSFTNNGNSVGTGDLLTLPDSSTREARVFFDTGNTTTQITRPMAASLGINLDIDTPDDTVELQAPGGTIETVPCYAISSAGFSSIGGNYVYAIASPLVCVSDRSAFALPQSNPHDVIIGTNYFEQTQILWNGPGDTVGLFQGVATNNAPTADAGLPQTIECDSMSGASVTLDGTGSSDPDGDPLSYLWTGSFGSETGAMATITQPLGVSTVTLTVNDGNGGTDSDSVEITVVDATAPTVDAGPDVTLEASSPDGAPYDVSTQVTASDACGAIGIAISPVSPKYPLGSTVVTVTATDASGNTDSDTVTVTVEDTTPPELSISVTPTMLWPPNHNMVPIAVTVTVFDIADPNPTVALILVQSDEGDGVDTFDPAFDVTVIEGRKGSDIQLINGQLFLRAERSGNSNGREYTITYEATDASGNSAAAIATVMVPHNQ